MAVSVEGFCFIESLKATVQPTVRKSQTFLGIGIVACARRALVQSHDDVCSDATFYIHYALWGEHVLGTVQMAAKCATFLCKFTYAGQGEYLKTARVGEYRLVPTVEFVQSSCLFQNLGARSQIKVVGIAQYDLCLYFLFQVAHGKPFHASYSAHGHEDGSLDLAMIGGNQASAGICLGVGMQKFKCHLPIVFCFVCLSWGNQFAESFAVLLSSKRNSMGLSTFSFSSA